MNKISVFNRKTTDAVHWDCRDSHDHDGDAGNNRDRSRDGGAEAGGRNHRLVIVARTLLLLVLTNPMVACATVQRGSFQTASMHGVAGTSTGERVPAAVLRIEPVDAAAVVFPRFMADSWGRFVGPPLPPGRYRVWAAADDLRSVPIEVEFVDRSQVLFVRLLDFDELSVHAVALLRTANRDQLEPVVEQLQELRPGHPLVMLLAAAADIFGGRYQAASARLVRANESARMQAATGAWTRVNAIHRELERLAPDLGTPAGSRAPAAGAAGTTGGAGAGDTTGTAGTAGIETGRREPPPHRPPSETSPLMPANPVGIGFGGPWPLRFEQ